MNDITKRETEWLRKERMEELNKIKKNKNSNKRSKDEKKI